MKTDFKLKMEFNKQEESKELPPEHIDGVVNSSIPKYVSSNQQYTEKELEHVDGASPENISVKKFFSKRKKEKNPERYQILECPDYLISWHYGD